jgi:phage terminase large subunit GpA-like protein
MAVDSGYRAGDVYEWCRRHDWMLPVKGVRGEVEVPDGLDKAIKSTTQIDRTPDGQRIEGVAVRIVNTGFVKRELYSAINAGRWHFPADVDDTFIGQLNSEKLVSRVVGGKPRQYYVRKQAKENEGETRNHYLDAVVYNVALLEVLRGDMTVPDAAARYYRKVARVARATYTE